MQLKALLVAFAASTVFATAVPAGEKKLDKRDYGYYGGCVAVTKYATKYSKTTTKYATKYSTKWSKTITKTSTKTSIKTSTRTSTRTNTKTVLSTKINTSTTTVTLPPKTVSTIVTGPATTVTSTSISTSISTTTVFGGQPTHAVGPRYAGCYKPNPANSKPLLAVVRPASSALTAELCQDGCSADGYPFSGVTGGNVCACGNGFNESWLETLDEKDCTSFCSGDQTAYCGGPDGIYDIYVTAPVLKNVGCYADTSNKFVLTDAYYVDEQMTQELCQKRCFDQDQTFAALKDGNACFCNDSFENPPVSVGTPDNCQLKCAGSASATEYCGGDGYISVFALTYN
ncbi:hypothetical protein ABW20_dc0110176 [Dactylellina cionopaga]|nr:hypothetical protein ABW20_dc0110176 [Dactylellina cionopaga]